MPAYARAKRILIRPLIMRVRGRSRAYFHEISSSRRDQEVEEDDEEEKTKTVGCASRSVSAVVLPGVPTGA